MPVNSITHVHMIYLGSDHAGYKLKQEVMLMLGEMNEPFEDLGNIVEDPKDDYPRYAFAVGEAVAANPGSFGILVCGSSQGVCIAANKVKGVRAVAVRTGDEAAKTRDHNDANVLCLAGWHQTPEEVGPVVEAFVGTDFPGEERHKRRIEAIEKYENERR